MLFLKLIRNFILYTFNNKKFTFYSESKYYQKNYIDFINELANKFSEEKIYYFSSDETDIINGNNQIINVFIGKGIFRVLFFIFVNSKYFFMTLTDLNNHELKKSQFVKEYIYIFHSTISLYRGYTEGAFDFYDTFFSIGSTCTMELNEIIKTRNLNTKKVEQIGYFLFSHLEKRLKNYSKKNYILIAPSWNKNPENFFLNDCFELIKSLLNKNLNVVLRPHPEHMKFNKNYIDFIKKSFMSNNNFDFDFEHDNIKSISESEYLITDYSGIAIEYTLIAEKPVIYFDQYLKLHNSNFEKTFNTKKLIEDEIKNLFGKSFRKDDLDNLSKELQLLKRDFELKKNEIRNYKKRNFFNYGDSIKIAISKLS